MRNFNPWLYVFFTAFGVHLIAILLGYELLTRVTKPMLLPALLLYYWIETKHTGGKISALVLAALFFSWLGDVLLMFQTNAALYFILGLSSFLLAHFFYILWFGKELKLHPKKPNWVYLSLVLLYASALLYILWPKLGEMKIPVFAYALVISTMLAFAIHAVPIKIQFPFKAILLLIGAKLFVISDSILAFNKFHTSFAAAGFLIMLTYGLAQYFLVKGILNRQVQEL